MLPALAWTLFAAYLNYSYADLNKPVEPKMEITGG